MKRRNIISAAVLPQSPALTASGCLKDDIYDKGLTQSEHATGPQAQRSGDKINGSPNTGGVAL